MKDVMPVLQISVDDTATPPALKGLTNSVLMKIVCRWPCKLNVRLNYFGYGLYFSFLKGGRKTVHTRRFNAENLTYES